MLGDPYLPKKKFGDIPLLLSGSTMISGLKTKSQAATVTKLSMCGSIHDNLNVSNLSLTLQEKESYESYAHRSFSA